MINIILKLVRVREVFAQMIKPKKKIINSVSYKLIFCQIINIQMHFL